MSPAELGIFTCRIDACHRCEHSRGCNGPCPCKADAEHRDIIELAKANLCPLGFFGHAPVTADDAPEKLEALLLRASTPRLPPDWHEWPNARSLLQTSLAELLDRAATSRILHVFHGLELSDHPDSARNVRARQTWEGRSVTLLPFHPARTAMDMGDSRPLPYINDLLDWACARAGEDAIIVWSNLDVCLAAGAYERIREALTFQDVVFSRRVDVDDASVEPPPEAMRDTAFEGMDLLAFRPRWWRAVRHEVPEMFLANTQFDTALRYLAARDSPVPEFHPRIIYHEKHGVSWWQANHAAPSSLHNRVEWEKWWAKYHPEFNRTGKVGWPLVPSDALPMRPHFGRIGRLRKVLNHFSHQTAADCPLDELHEAMRSRLKPWEPPLVIVETGHHGDLLYLLPALQWLHEHGHAVVYCCKPQYMEGAEGIDWITCAPYESDEQAARLGRVLKPGGGANWAQSSWERTGVPMDLRHTLPLIIPNRRPHAEAALRARHVRGQRPLIVFNATGFSSPFPRGPELLEAIRSAYPGCEVVDLGAIQAQKLRDLCGIIQRAAAIVTIDTATLHLAYATGTPTIALLPRNQWQSSEPRPHWKLMLRYDEALAPDGLRAILTAIQQALAGNRQSMPFASRLAHGTAGAAQAVLRIGRAPAEVIAARTAVCEQCDQWERLPVGHRCKACGCTGLKLLNAAEKCPLGKW